MVSQFHRFCLEHTPVARLSLAQILSMQVLDNLHDLGEVGFSQELLWHDVVRRFFFHDGYVVDNAVWHGFSDRSCCSRYLCGGFVNGAGGGIRTHEPLRDEDLNLAPLISSFNLAWRPPLLSSRTLVMTYTKVSFQPTSALYCLARST